MEFQRIALVWGKGGAEMLAYLEEIYPGCEIITYHPTGYDAEFPNGDYTRLDPAYDIPDFRQCGIVAYCEPAGDKLDRTAVDVNVARGIVKALEYVEGVIWRGGVLGDFLREKYKIPMLYPEHRDFVCEC